MKDETQIAKTCLSMYLQSWGQSAKEQITALNDASEAAGIQAKFKQGPNGENAGWYGEDSDKGVEFRREIDRCWRGSFEEETAAILDVIHSFQQQAVTTRP